LVGAEAWKAATADSMTIGHQANNLGSIKLSGTENPIDVFEVSCKFRRVNELLLSLAGWRSIQKILQQDQRYLD
jgi:hypothetical protein